MQLLASTRAKQTNSHPVWLGYFALASVGIFLMSTAAAGPDSSEIYAENDSVRMTAGEFRFINVLGNDAGAESSPVRVELVSTPEHGFATAIPQYGNTILFQAFDDATDDQYFVYRITDSSGNSSTAVVWVDIVCQRCTETRSVTLYWDEGPETVEGYHVYYGPSASQVDNHAFDVPHGFPWASFNPGVALRLEPGSSVCFRVTAHNDDSESDPSDAVCGTI